MTAKTFYWQNHVLLQYMMHSHIYIYRKYTNKQSHISMLEHILSHYLNNPLQIF